MSQRKATPDVLGEMLGDPDRASATPPAPRQTPASKKSRPKQANQAPAEQAQTQAGAAVPAPRTVVWDYLTVVLGDHHGLRPKSMNGRALETWKAQPEISDFLAVVGRYGWEMVGIVDKGCGEKEAYFKRPKE